MSLADFYAMTVIGLSSAGLTGFIIGRRIGRNEERVRQAMRRARQRRPLTVNVDYEFAVRALNHAGYTVGRERKEELH